MALPGGFVQKDESTGESVLRETRKKLVWLFQKKILSNCIHSVRLIEIREAGSSPVSYLAFIGEEPLIAGDDAKEVRWFTPRTS